MLEIVSKQKYFIKQSFKPFGVERPCTVDTFPTAGKYFSKEGIVCQYGHDDYFTLYKSKVNQDHNYISGSNH